MSPPPPPPHPHTHTHTHTHRETVHMCGHTSQVCVRMVLLVGTMTTASKLLDEHAWAKKGLWRAISPCTSHSQHCVLRLDERFPHKLLRSHQAISQACSGHLPGVIPCFPFEMPAAYPTFLLGSSWQFIASLLTMVRCHCLWVSAWHRQTMLLNFGDSYNPFLTMEWDACRPQTRADAVLDSWGFGESQASACMPGQHHPACCNSISPAYANPQFTAASRYGQTPFTPPHAVAAADPKTLRLAFPGSFPQPASAAVPFVSMPGLPCRGMSSHAA